MFEKVLPEQVGISSARLSEFLSVLERRGAIMHSIIITRYGKTVLEKYWEPFNKDGNHRMYSSTKSYTAIGIGLLEEEGKLSLDERLVDIFPDKIDGEVSEYLKEQTVRQMLTMTTVGNPRNWFKETDPDRVHLYMNMHDNPHPAGTVWEYDSAASQVLATIVEKRSGMELMDYLKLKLFNKMGTFKNARILKTRNGDAWGDSALLCTTRDAVSFAQLLMDGGVWKGERLMNEEFVRTATSKVVDNRHGWAPGCYTHGYGYQIWRTEQNGFSFLGMGDELTVALPDRGIILSTTADHQGTNNLIRNIMINAFFDIVVNNTSDTELPAAPEAYEKLERETANLKLFSLKGMEDSPFRAELCGREYLCDKNPMGITSFSFRFNDAESGEFRYVNAQGEKVIPFGVNKNVFGKFPQLGYSNEFGGLRTTDGFMYKDAVSFAWLEEKKFMLFVQIIDNYLGLMSATFAFRDGYAAAQFEKIGEDFLDEYQGELSARLK